MEGLIRVAVAEGVAVFSMVEIVGDESPGVRVMDGVEDGSPVIPASLVFSDSSGSIVAVRVRLVTISSPDIFIGVFVLVNVALEAKGVSVEVPFASLLTIFVLE